MNDSNFRSRRIQFYTGVHSCICKWLNSIGKCNTYVAFYSSREVQENVKSYITVTVLTNWLSLNLDSQETEANPPKAKIICLKFMKTFTIIGKLAKVHAVEIIAGEYFPSKLYCVLIKFNAYLITDQIILTLNAARTCLTLGWNGFGSNSMGFLLCAGMSLSSARELRIKS